MMGPEATTHSLFLSIYKYPFTQIGKMFGVTDNTIRKWCKKYNLPFRRRDIDNNEQVS